jgi:hypothetical protein
VYTLYVDEAGWVQCPKCGTTLVHLDDVPLWLDLANELDAHEGAEHRITQPALDLGVGVH